ncbi:MAG: glycosyltransferase [Patescibacteria group bacterium]|jgi:glycosyltransferase involved in cell wall biosynthesis
MKIAIVSSNEQLTPPPDNVIVASMNVSTFQTVGLSALGHEVYAVVGKGSTIKTHRVESFSKPVFETIDKEVWQSTGNSRLMYQIIVPFEIDLHLTLLDFLKTHQVDLVHFHTIKPYIGLPFAMRVNVPCFFTLHSPGTAIEVDTMKAFNSKNIHYISISKNQQKSYGGLQFAGTVHNGLDLKASTFNVKGGNNLVIGARILPEKGIYEGILAAGKTGKNLDIAGEVRSSSNQYYIQKIEPLLKQYKNIQFLQFMNHNLMNSFFGTGKASLVPIQWEEPFGLVMIESMATGTPVIAFARGSVPEVIKDGETGFIVNSSDDDIRGNWVIKKTGIDGLCEAIEKVYTMSEDRYQDMRRACRNHVEQNFTVEKMAKGYEKIYQEVLSESLTI